MSKLNTLLVEYKDVLINLIQYTVIIPLSVYYIGYINICGKFNAYFNRQYLADMFALSLFPVTKQTYLMNGISYLLQLFWSFMAWFVIFIIFSERFKRSMECNSIKKLTIQSIIIIVLPMLINVVYLEYAIPFICRANNNLLTSYAPKIYLYVLFLLILYSMRFFTPMNKLNITSSSDRLFLISIRIFICVYFFISMSFSIFTNGFVKENNNIKMYDAKLNKGNLVNVTFTDASVVPKDYIQLELSADFLLLYDVSTKRVIIYPMSQIKSIEHL